VREMTAIESTSEKLAIAEWLFVCTPPRGVAGLRSHKDFAAWQLAYEFRRALLPLLRRILQARDFALRRMD
jgi:hypothetical protein